MKVSTAPLSGTVERGLANKIGQGVCVVIPCQVAGRIGYLVIPIGSEPTSEAEAKEILKDIKAAI